MKNIFIITILSLFFCNVGFAETITGGPNTTDEAIEQFFKGRKLDKIEGIWHEDVEGAKYAIVKGNDEIYEIWTVEHKISIFSGTKDTNMYLKKTSEDKDFSFSTTVYNPADINEQANGHGRVILLNDNVIQQYIFSGCYSEGRCWKTIESTLKRIWP